MKPLPVPGCGWRAARLDGERRTPHLYGALRALAMTALIALRLLPFGSSPVLRRRLEGTA